MSSTILATVFGRLGDDQRAYHLFAQSQEMYQDLIDRYPSVANHLSGFISSYFSQAQFASQRRDFHPALDAYTHIVEIVYNSKPWPRVLQANVLS
ncbi:MAG: hypothetical protein ACK449_19185 [Planctomycetota bacterium]|jgi:hypothetical protein